MNMTDLAIRTAQLWLEFAVDEQCAPAPELPPDPYNKAFYSFTCKDPDNEVSGFPFAVKYGSSSERGATLQTSKVALHMLCSTL